MAGLRVLCRRSGPLLSSSHPKLSSARRLPSLPLCTITTSASSSATYSSTSFSTFSHTHTHNSLTSSSSSTAAALLHTSATMGAGFKQSRGTGDGGKSSLYNNERRWKDDETFEAVGTIDELSAVLGVCRSHADVAVADQPLGDVIELLTRLQCCLQDVGAHVATPPESTERKKKLTSFDVDMVEWIDAEIDHYGDQLPPIRQFILSGGGVMAAHLQHARTIARRAERRLVPLVREEQIDPKALKFVNRMSDLLFVLGRYACMRCHQEELTYLRPKTFTDQKWNRKKLSNSPDGSP